MWYSRVTANLGAIPDFIAYYETELESAKTECRVGGLIEKNIAALPGITEHRFNQLQEIEAILNYLIYNYVRFVVNISKNILKDTLVH